MTSAVKPRDAAQRRYMRMSMFAQSCASVPPAPAWMSMKALWESISPWNMRFNSSLRTRSSRPAASFSISAATLASFSASASSSSSSASEMALLVAIQLFELGGELGAFAAELACAVGVLPDGRLFQLAAYLFEAFLLAVVLKETP